MPYITHGQFDTLLEHFMEFTKVLELLGKHGVGEFRFIA